MLSGEDELQSLISEIVTEQQPLSSENIPTSLQISPLWNWGSFGSFSDSKQEGSLSPGDSSGSEAVVPNMDPNAMQLDGQALLPPSPISSFFFDQVRLPHSKIPLNETISFVSGVHGVVTVGNIVVTDSPTDSHVSEGVPVPARVAHCHYVCLTRTSFAHPWLPTYPAVTLQRMSPGTPQRHHSGTPETFAPPTGLMMAARALSYDDTMGAEHTTPPHGHNSRLTATPRTPQKKGYAAITPTTPVDAFPAFQSLPS